MTARPKHKRSAGILVHRASPHGVEVLLVHPGGPFWVRKDDGAWFVPKGEINADEEPLAAAYREFEEELGFAAPAGEPLDLGTVKNKGGKVIHCWALSGDCDLAAFRSNTFRLEWPPRSGVEREFPEVDRAQYFSVEQAQSKMHPAELPLVERLLAHLARADQS
jgi:predicted NUDIX family NTP pyrophosphohydrolase